MKYQIKLKQSQKNKSFTIIELIFVLLIIAILASYFIPKLSNITNSNKITQCKSDLNIIKYQLNNLKNKTILKQENINFDISNYLNNNWKKISNNKYYFIIDKNTTIEFILDLNKYEFSCNKNNTLCKKVLN